MATVRIRVVGADGKYRGGLFKDGPGNVHRWEGRTTATSAEHMVCMDAIESGEWFLLQYVLPQQLEAEESRDDLADIASICRRQTPAQALQWFQQQPLDPPPGLIKRVRQLAYEWTAFRTCPAAMDLLRSLVARATDVSGSDPALAAYSHDVLALLVRLDAIHERTTAIETTYSPNCIALDMGAEAFVAWATAQLGRLGELIPSPAPEAATHRDEAITAAEPLVAIHAATKTVCFEIGAVVGELLLYQDFGAAFDEIDALLSGDIVVDQDGLTRRDKLGRALVRLRRALADAVAVRDDHTSAVRLFWGGCIGATYSFAGVAGASLHDVVVDAATVFLAQPPSRTPRDYVTALVADPICWKNLARDLDEELDLARRYLPERPPPVSAQPAERFGTVALTVLDTARSIARFLVGYATETVEVTRRMPAELLAPTFELAAAEQYETFVRHRFDGLVQDKWWSPDVCIQLDRATAKSPEDRAALHQLYVEKYRRKLGEVETRVRTAREAYQSSFAARKAAEQALKGQWVHERQQALRPVLAEFRSLFAQFRGRIAGSVDISQLKLGQFKEAASACAALERFADSALQPDVDQAEFEGLDPDQLRVAVEQEAGILIRAAPAAPMDRASHASQQTVPLDPSANDLRPPPDRPAFLCHGDSWELRFMGQTHHMAGSVGFRYLQTLLRESGRPVSATELYGQSPLSIGSRQEVLDEQAVDDMQEEIGELADEIAAAKERHDYGEQERLTVEKERIEDELKRYASGDHRRQLKSPQSDTVGRVRVAIHRALRAIRTKFPDLGNHLDESLIEPGGASPCYRPLTPQTWIVNA